MTKSENHKIPVKNCHLTDLITVEVWDINGTARWKRIWEYSIRPRFSIIDSSNINVSVTRIVKPLSTFATETYFRHKTFL